MHDDTGNRTPAARRWPWLLLLFAVTVVAYVIDPSSGVGGALRGGFVFDDVHLIVENDRLADASGAWDGFTGDYYTSSVRSATGEERALGYYRPLAVLSNWIDYRIWGDRAFGFHLTNLLLHTAVVLLFFLLLDRLTRRRALAAGAAFLFALHPVHVESVTFISGRVDVLAAFFSLLALLALAASFERPNRTAGLSALSLLAFLLALLSKEMAVTLPAAVFVLAWIYGPEPRSARRAILRALPYVGVIAVYAGMRLAAIGSLVSRASAERDPGEIFRQVAYVVSTYLGLLVWPPMRFNVEPQPEIPGTVNVRILLGVALIVAVAVVAFLPAVRRRLPSVSAGLLWALAALVPVSHILPVETLIGERYLYIPSLGACLALAGLLAFLVARVRPAATGGRVLTLVVLVVGVAYGANIVKRNTYFADNLTFWTAKSWLTTNAESLTAVAIEQQRSGDIAGAAQTYAAALEKDPEHLEALNNYALLLLQQGFAREALQLASRAIGKSPTYAEGLNTAANAFHALGRFPEAVGQYKRALRARPDYRDAWVNLGNTYFAAGVPDSAARAYREALSLAPERDVTIQLARCVALKNGTPAGMQVLYDAGVAEPETVEAYLLQSDLDFLTGYHDAAVASALRATQADPSSVEAWIELGRLFALTKRYPAARDAFQRALALAPNLSVVHNNLGVLARDTGNLDEALQHFNRAVDLSPNDPEALRNLGAALLDKGNAEMAIEVLDRAVNAGRDAMAFFHRGRARQEMGTLTPAINDYRAALVLNPQLAEAHFRLGTLYALSDREPEAIQEYESFLRFSPPNDSRREAVTETLQQLRAKGS